MKKNLPPAQPGFHPPQGAATLSSRPRSRTGGFTLAEMLAVIAIMVLLMSFTIPMIRFGADPDKAAWEISGLIGQARAVAMSENTYTWVLLYDTSTTTPPEYSTTVVVLSSKDGTQSTLAGNLNVVSSKLIKGMTVQDLSDTPYGNRIANADEDDTTVYLFHEVPLAKFPGVYQGFVKLQDDYRCRTLVISSMGEVITLGGSLHKIVEVGLVPQVSATPTDAEKANSAVLQISGLTGGIRIFRP